VKRGVINMKNLSSNIWKFITSVCAVIGLASVADSIILWVKLIQDGIQLYRSITYPIYHFIFSFIDCKISHSLYDIISIFFFFAFNAKAEVVNRLTHWYFVLYLFGFAFLPVLIITGDDYHGNPLPLKVLLKKIKFIYFISIIIGMAMSILTSLIAIAVFLIMLMVFVLTLPIYTFYSFVPGFKFYMLLKALPDDSSRDGLGYALGLKLDSALNNSYKLSEFLKKNDIKENVSDIFGFTSDNIDSLYEYLLSKYYNFLSAHCFVESAKLSVIFFLIIIIANQVKSKM
jgi:hypothetical protein